MSLSRTFALLALVCISSTGSSPERRPLPAERNIATVSSQSSAPTSQLPWVRRVGPEQAKGVIVFIHGVLGDSRSTWSNGSVYWPALLTTDTTFDGNDIYVYGYPSPKFGRSLSVDEVAENLRLVLATDGVLRYKQLTFVSHSMGGLITRAFIIKYQSQIASHIRLLYFFATPTTGSPYAILARLFSKNQQFGQLYPMDADSYLGPLQSNWLAANLKLRSYCAYETKTVLGQLIVERQSATNLCTERLDPIDANHIDIVKPSDANSNSYRALKAAFEETAVSAASPPQRPIAPKSDRNPQPELLFGSADRAKLRFGILLGWQLARFEFIDGSEFAEAKAVAPGVRNEIFDLLAQDGYPQPSVEQNARGLITGVLARYGTTDVYKHGAVLVGIAAFRMSLIGASANEADNQEIEQLAASAVAEIDPTLIRRKGEFLRVLRQKRPKTTTEVLAMIDSLPRN